MPRMTSVYLPRQDLPAIRARLRPEDGAGTGGALLVACLCAVWCRTCDAYLDVFKALAAGHPQACFVWLDVESFPELIDDAEIENFPTLLIQDEQATRFFGTVLPHKEVLARLIAQAIERTGAVMGEQAPPLRLRLTGLQTA